MTNLGIRYTVFEKCIVAKFELGASLYGHIQNNKIKSVV